MQKRLNSLSAIAMAFVLLISACNMVRGGTTPLPLPATQPPTLAGSPTTPPTDTPIPASPPPGSLYNPADPPTVVSKINDPVFPSSTGDNYSVDLYERPFQPDNTYRPDADIKFSFLADDGEWYYFSTQLVDVNPATKTLDAAYGIEIDTNLDGRGDFLLWATPPYTSSWTKNNVQVRADANHDVGNRRPLLSDAPSKGDGYENVIFDGGKGPDPDAAWVRQDPKDPSYLQIAVKKATIGAKVFLWNPWMDFSPVGPDQFDFNDFFTAAEAGSPYASSSYYPLKALYGIDNTCREAYGFTPTGHEPGICNPAKPAATAKPAAKPTNTLPAPPPPAQPGSINGVVYIDNNGNGVQDAGEPGASAYWVYLFAGTCTGSSISSTTSDSNGNYSFPNLSAGSYCVNLFYSGSPVKPTNPQLISVSSGGASRVNFGIVPPG